MKTVCVILSLITTALAFGCKQCIYMRSDNDHMNEFLDSQMSGAMSGGPVSYTADCKDNASDITSTTCPANMGCMSIKIKALYAAGENVNMDIYLRLCGGKGEVSTGCNDIEIFEDKIRESMGPSVANLEDLTGAVCVCEEDNCNIQQSSELIPGGNSPPQDMCMPQCQNGCYGSDINECCDHECSGGCSGPGSANCTLCRNYMNEGNCVANCPPEELYNPDTFQFEDNPDFKYYHGRNCVGHCPDDFFMYHGACVSWCPRPYTSNDNRQCVHV